jgi:hypothetical protein
MWLADAAPRAHVWLADVNPIPPAALPGKAGSALNTIIGWSLTVGLLMCVLGGVTGWILVAIGNNTERENLHARGKKGVFWSLIAACGIGLIFGLVNAFYDLGK